MVNPHHSSHHHETPLQELLREFPDYKSFKVENAPRVMKVQKDLAKFGLKDPWARNYSYLYDGRFGTKGSRMFSLIFAGFDWGLYAFLATVAFFKIKQIISPVDEHEEHVKCLKKYGIDPIRY